MTTIYLEVCNDLNWCKSYSVWVLLDPPKPDMISALLIPRSFFKYPGGRWKIFKHTRDNSSMYWWKIDETICNTKMELTEYIRDYLRNSRGYEKYAEDDIELKYGNPWGLRK